MTAYEISTVFTWAAIIGIVAKYFFDSGNIKQKLRRSKGDLSSVKENLQLVKDGIIASESKTKKHLANLADTQEKALNNFSSAQTKELAEMNSHLRDKLLEYGTQIAELHFKIRELEEKYQLNAVELQEVEYSLEELKEVFGTYYAFLTEFAEEFGLDNSKLYQELMARTKAIYELVEEVVGRIHGGTNGQSSQGSQNGVRTVATIGKVKAG
jgi:chromosome segregation ATPase